MGKQIFNRATGTCYNEEQFMEKEVSFLYRNSLGRALLKTFLIRRRLSRIFGARYDSRKSIKKIEPFIRTHNICMDDFPKREYRSFNDFFARTPSPGKRPLDDTPDSLISPADAKLLWLPVTADLRFTVKDYTYSVSEFVKDSSLADRYMGGDCLVFRLTVDDLHRYIFIDDGSLLFQKEIPGVLHTVGPYSDGENVFCENHRILSLLHTRHFGDVAAVEIGALLVGKIINHDKSHFTRGEEKGYFVYGGSTIALLFEAGRVKPDADILEKSIKDIEVKVRMGEKIGTCIFP